MADGPKNSKTDRSGARVYRWRDEEFTSVTTIIGDGVPKPALTNWAAKMVAEFVADNPAVVMDLVKRDKAAAIDMLKGSPWRKRDAAAAKGSTIHRYAEAYVLGQPMPPIDETLAAYMSAFTRFLDDFEPEYLAAEFTVYNRAAQYAGTADALARINGEVWLLDTKTGKDVYGETSLQLAAYRHAEFIGVAETGDELPLPEIDRCGVLHLTPNGYALVPVEAGEREFRLFRYVQQVAWFQKVHSRQVVGAPLKPPKFERPTLPANVSALVD